MEIKTASAKPLWLSHMLDEYDIKRSSFSKYGTEFKNLYKSGINQITYINPYDLIAERGV